jgi:hypothetical protein
MLGLTGTTMMHQAISSLNIINDRKRLEIFFEDCLMAWFLWYAKF